MTNLTKNVETEAGFEAPTSTDTATKSHRMWWHVALETAALIAIGLAGLEVALGACGVGMEEILQPDPIMGVKHIPNKKVVWRMEGYSADSFSSLGMRDVEHSITKPANVYRIALLGDSATEGLQVPLKDTYASSLQSLLQVPGKKVEVLNFGCSSYSTGQEVLQFEREVAQYKPDLTILLYNRGDAIENIRRPGDLKCEPRPYFYVDSKGTLHEDDAVLQANAKALQPNPVIDTLRRHSKVYGVFSHANLTLSLNEPLYHKVRGWISAPFNMLAKKPKGPASVVNSANVSSTTADTTTVAQNGMAVTEGLLRRLNADCVKCGSKLLVLDFPNAVLDPDFANQIAAISKVGQSAGFETFDLTEKFHYHPKPTSLFLKYHFSAPGHLFVAKRIAEHLDGIQR